MYGRYDYKKTGIQAKFKVSQPGDVFQQEADRVAEQIMRMSTPNRVGLTQSNEEERLGRKCSSCKMKKEEEEKLNIARKPSTSANFETGSETANNISNVRYSEGSSLDRDSQELMKSTFGHDLSGVRIHADANAAKSARLVNALAYTVGEDIVFGEGQYSPVRERDRWRARNT